eukprot:CFRG4708T1
MDKITIAVMATSVAMASVTAQVNGGKYAYLAVKGGDYDVDGFNAEGYNVWGFNRDMVDKWDRPITDPLAGLIDPNPNFIEPPAPPPPEDDKKYDDDDDDDDKYPIIDDLLPLESLPFPPVVISTPYYTPLWNDRPANPSVTPHFCDGSYIEFIVGDPLDYEMAAWYLFDVCSLLDLTQDGFRVESMYVKGNKTHILVDFCKEEDVRKVEMTASSMPVVLAGPGLMTEAIIVQDGSNWNIIPVTCPAAKENNAFVKDGQCIPCPPSPGCIDGKCTSDGIPVCPSRQCEQGYAWSGTACQLCDFFYGGDYSKGRGCPESLRRCQDENSLPLPSNDWEAFTCAIDGPSYACNTGFGFTIGSSNITSEFFGPLEGTSTVCAPCVEDIQYPLSCNGELESGYCMAVVYEEFTDNVVLCVEGCCAEGYSNQKSVIASECVL